MAGDRGLVAKDDGLTVLPVACTHVMTPADLHDLKAGRLSDRLRPLVMTGDEDLGADWPDGFFERYNAVELVLWLVFWFSWAGVTTGFWLSTAVGAVLGGMAMLVLLFGLLPAILLSICKPAPHFFAARALARDLARGVVQTAEAEICAHQCRYISRVGGRRLTMTVAAGVRLRSILTRHRAYFLPSSGLVLHVEPLGSDESAYRSAPARGSTRDLTVVTRALANAHGFDVAWLEENRQGRWAKGQIWMLRRRRLLMPAALGALVLDYFYLLWMEYAGWSQPPSPVWLVVGVVLAGAWLAWAGMRARKVTDECSTPNVVAVEGRPRFTTHPPGPNAYYEPGHEIEGLRFPAELWIHRLMVEGLVYRFHVSAPSKILLGIEAVREDDSGELAATATATDETS